MINNRNSSLIRLFSNTLESNLTSKLWKDFLDTVTKKDILYTFKELDIWKWHYDLLTKEDLVEGIIADAAQYSLDDTKDSIKKFKIILGNKN